MENLVFYLTINYPDTKSFFEILDSLKKYKVTYVEIGIPVANPYLDGDIIKETHKHVLANGLNHEKIVALIKKIQQDYDFRIVLMTYKEAVTKFDLASIDNSLYDSILCVDEQLDEKLFGNLLYLVDTYSEDNKKQIESSKPFVYVRTGVGKTGGFSSLPTQYIETVRKIKHHTNAQPFVGFGIKSPENVKEVLKNGADGAIIGTEFLKRYMDSGVEGIEEYLGSFVK